MQEHKSPRWSAFCNWPTFRYWPLLSWIILVVFSACLAGCDTRPPSSAAAGPGSGLIGSDLPALDVEPVVNITEGLTLADVAGQVVLINFWGPWCVPCRIEMPHIVELEKRLRERDDFRFVSISCKADASYALQEETERYISSQGIEFAVYSDLEGKTRWPLMDALGSSGEFQYPTTILVGRQGKVRGFWAGYQPGLEKEVSAAVDEALSQK